MDPIERVNSLFAGSAETCQAAAQAQAPSIARAAQRIVDSLLGGGKILCCGNGGSAADAQYFAAQMQHRFRRERPGLPAVALGTDAATLTAIAAGEGFSEIYAKQISALGHPGDVLLAFSIDGMAPSIVAAVAAAQDRQMPVIAVSGSGGGLLAEHLRTSDIEVRAPSLDAARILENHRLVIHCLCDLIDLLLMGS